MVDVICAIVRFTDYVLLHRQKGPLYYTMYILIDHILFKNQIQIKTEIIQGYCNLIVPFRN